MDHPVTQSSLHCNFTRYTSRHRPPGRGRSIRSVTPDALNSPQTLHTIMAHPTQGYFLRPSSAFGSSYKARARGAVCGGSAPTPPRFIALGLAACGETGRSAPRVEGTPDAAVPLKCSGRFAPEPYPQQRQTQPATAAHDAASPNAINRGGFGGQSPLKTKSILQSDER